MSNSPNCAWAHYVRGIRFEAVPMDGAKTRWRLFNRTHGVLLDPALGFTEAVSRGELLLNLDHAAASMGQDAFSDAVVGAGMDRKVVTLLRSGCGFKQDLGQTEIAFPAQTAVHDVLQFALYELADGGDAGPGVLAQIQEPSAIAMA